MPLNLRPDWTKTQLIVNLETIVRSQSMQLHYHLASSEQIWNNRVQMGVWEEKHSIKWYVAEVFFASAIMFPSIPAIDILLEIIKKTSCLGDCVHIVLNCFKLQASSCLCPRIDNTRWSFSSCSEGSMVRGRTIMTCDYILLDSW